MPPNRTHSADCPCAQHKRFLRADFSPTSATHLADCQSITMRLRANRLTNVQPFAPRLSVVSEVSVVNTVKVSRYYCRNQPGRTHDDRSEYCRAKTRSQHCRPFLQRSQTAGHHKTELNTAKRSSCLAQCCGAVTSQQGKIICPVFIVCSPGQRICLNLATNLL